jgi:addiction module HigA family antidote
MTKRSMQPIHPGEVLSRDFLKPHNLSASALAQSLYVPPNRMVQIVSGKRTITADTALRLSRYFGTSREFWMTLQMEFELRTAEQVSPKSLEWIRPQVSAKTLGGDK